MNRKNAILGMFTMASAVAFAGTTPVVTSVTMVQPNDTRRTTVTYTLDNAPSVVTFDVQTNYTENGVTKWASIGGAAVSNAKGAVWRKVTEDDMNSDGKYEITWRPDQSWPDHKIADGGARAVVTAWALDNTPAYMVVDISAAAKPNTQTYYPSVDHLPGGLLGNDNYRTTKIVMRKIMAKDVEWTMGSTTLETKRSTDGRENSHQVTLTNNYYIGVFPVTQAQWDLIQPNRLAPSMFENPAFRAMRPVENVCYNEIRMSNNSTSSADGAAEWPAAPYGKSVLGLLRTKTGIDFDLPSEAQWEFAARAGNGDTKWGDGSGILNMNKDANLGKLGRYLRNGGYINETDSPPADCTADHATAVVGTCKQNDWGLYDVHGNVWELCLDWFEIDITSKNGAVVNVKGSMDGRVVRGGSWNREALYARSAYRRNVTSDKRDVNLGFRLACTAGLE